MLSHLFRWWPLVIFHNIFSDRNWYFSPTRSTLIHVYVYLPQHSMSSIYTPMHFLYFINILVLHCNVGSVGSRRRSRRHRYCRIFSFTIRLSVRSEWSYRTIPGVWVFLRMVLVGYSPDDIPKWLWTWSHVRWRRWVSEMKNWKENKERMLALRTHRHNIQTKQRRIMRMFQAKRNKLTIWIWMRVKWNERNAQTATAGEKEIGHKQRQIHAHEMMQTKANLCIWCVCVRPRVCCSQNPDERCVMRSDNFFVVKLKLEPTRTRCKRWQCLHSMLNSKRHRGL